MALQRAKIDARMSISTPAAVQESIGSRPALLLQFPDGLQWAACRVEPMGGGQVVEFWLYNLPLDGEEGQMLKSGYVPVLEPSTPPVVALIAALETSRAESKLEG